MFIRQRGIFSGHCKLWRGFGDKPGNQCGGLLTHQLCGIILVQLMKFDQRLGQPWLATNLAGPKGSKQMDDFRCRNRYGIPHQPTTHDTFARVFSVQMVGNTSTRAIKLNPGPDGVAIGQITIQ